MDFDQLVTLLRARRDQHVDYVLVGGIALGLHGLARASEDVGVFVDGKADNIERLRRALHSIWDDDEIDEITTQDLNGEYPGIRYGPPDGQLAIDIMTRLGTGVHYKELRWEEVQMEGVAVRVATPAALCEMKRDTVRPIDLADARAPRKRFKL